MKFRKKKTRSPMEEAVYTVQKKLTQWDKQRKHWKRRIYLTIVFPVFLMLVVIKAVKTYVRIKLWEIGTKAPSPFQNENKPSKENEAVKTLLSDQITPSEGREKEDEKQ